MRLIFSFVLLFGLALAGGAVYLAKDYIGNYQQALAQERQKNQAIVKTVPVFVAARSLAYGDDLLYEDVRSVQWPEDAIPEGSFTSSEALFPEGETRQRVVLRAMEKDEAILAIKVTAPGEDAGLTSRLEKGMRAFALKVDVASGVSGFLRPGDRVDVYWTGKVNASNRQDRASDVTKLIEAGVKLIAIDQSAGGDIEGATIAQTVTVSVSPQQVAALAQAQTTGRLSLSLVGSDDDIIAEAVEVDQNALLGIVAQETAEEVAQDQRVCTIRTRRGAEVVDIPIPCSD
ncbi:MAG: Flp pilus assembly protein CpaB [Paracoccaceae bacterium]